MGHLEGIAVFQLRSTMLSVTPRHELVEARDLVICDVAAPGQEFEFAAVRNGSVGLG